MLSSTAQTYGSFEKLDPLINRAHILFRQSMMTDEECKAIQNEKMGCTYVFVNDAQQWHLFYINKSQLKTMMSVDLIKGLDDLLCLLAKPISNRATFALIDKIGSLIDQYNKKYVLAAHSKEKKEAAELELNNLSYLQQFDDFVASEEWEDFGLYNVTQAQEKVVTSNDDLNQSLASRWISANYWVDQGMNLVASLFTTGRESKTVSSSTAKSAMSPRK